MKSLLEGWGFKAIVAGSCDEMLPLLANLPDRPALIICDYRLRAHEDGIRVIERLALPNTTTTSIPGMLDHRRHGAGPARGKRRRAGCYCCTSRCRTAGCAPRLRIVVALQRRIRRIVQKPCCLASGVDYVRVS